MKTLIDHMDITYSEYAYFKELSNADKLQYMFESYESRGTSHLNLSTFFESIKSALIQEHDTYVKSNNYLEDNQKVDVTIDDTNILIETNSLKALKHVSYRFVESGYILQRDRLTEKMFYKNKNTKYLRVFRILNYASSICSN
mgnify:CR=1 FL=1|tara:strand:+ start:2928 stop:3356 length:429 start_codon:yes stop_codon:yes gene_type:complete